MSTNGKTAGIAGVEVKVAGQPLNPTLTPRLEEVRVEDHLTLPDAFLIRLSDPGLTNIDTQPFEVGAEVEISLAGPEGNRLSPILKGQVVALEPEFRKDGVSIVARGYDHSHALNRSRKNATYQDTTVGDVVKKVAEAAGFTAKVEDAGGTQKFIQQSNETDWEFLWRLARRVGSEVVVLDKELQFRKAGGGESSGEPPVLRYGQTLLSFRPRLTGVQQVDEVVVRGWDQTTKRAIEATAKTDQTTSTIGVKRADVASALSGGKLAVSDVPVTTQEEADALAKSVASKVANAYLEAEGTCRGNPRLKAGGQVKVEGVGSRFSGTYQVSSTTHVFRGASGYETRFRISGGSSRSLVELMTPATLPGHETGGVQVGLVTQIEDPEKMGRVRIQLPELGGETEGWWARIAAPGAGPSRGQLMTPLVGDEVLVAFEHGDTRFPYVLGALWGGEATPGELVQTDGSHRLHSDATIGISAKKEITISSDENVDVKVGSGTVKMGKDGSIGADGKEVKVKGGSNVTVESTGSLTIKAGGSITIQATGTVKISGAQVQLG